MNKQKMDIVHSYQLILMDEIHRICMENNITYYLIGGSALGARRHGGFIPWDADIDIAMPREDYEKYGEIAENAAKHDFEYCSYKNTENHQGPHAIMYYKKAKLVYRDDDLNDEAVRPYIYIDIFPLDYAPEDERLQKEQAKRIKRINKFIYYKICRIYTDNSFAVKISKKILRGILSSISLDLLNKKRDEIMRQYDTVPTKYLCSMCSHYSYKKQCMDKAIYGTPQLAKFEDREYYIPQRNEEYLTRIYGDFMKIPSEEEIMRCYEMLRDIIPIESLR